MINTLYSLSSIRIYTQSLTFPLPSSLPLSYPPTSIICLMVSFAKYQLQGIFAREEVGCENNHLFIIPTPPAFPHPFQFPPPLVLPCTSVSFSPPFSTFFQHFSFPSPFGSSCTSFSFVHPLAFLHSFQLSPHIGSFLHLFQLFPTPLSFSPTFQLSPALGSSLHLF